MKRVVVGVDVQVSRGCPYAVVADGHGDGCDGDAVVVEQGWVDDAAGLRAVVVRLAAHAVVDVGIDAPRMPLPGPRPWALEGGRWVRAPRDTGRHAELVVKALGLANPQWTPQVGRVPPWMALGFSLFAALDDIAGVTTHEVFPSLSYTMFEAQGAPRATLPLGAFVPGPKDMLDAVVAAVSVREFIAGRGVEVGGGDGLGTIVLPRPLSSTQASHAALAWPAS